MKRGWHRASLLLAFFAANGAPMYAGGLSIKVPTRAECDRLCGDLVFDCNVGVTNRYNPTTQWCMVWNDAKPPVIDSGFAIRVPTESDCDVLAKGTGLSMYFDNDWCIEGKKPLVCTKASWDGIWTDTAYKKMRLSATQSGITGIYQLGVNDYLVRGSYEAGNKCVIIGEWDHKQGTTGPFRWQLTSQTRFDGSWAAKGKPVTAKSPKNWWGKR